MSTIIIEAKYYSNYKREFEGDTSKYLMNDQIGYSVLDNLRFALKDNGSDEYDIEKALDFSQLAKNLLTKAETMLLDVTIEISEDTSYASTRIVFSGLFLDRYSSWSSRQLICTLINEADSFQLDTFHDDLICTAVFDLSQHRC